MQIGSAGHHTPACGPNQEALLDEKGLDDIFERPALLPDGGRDAVDADGTSVEALDDGGQELAVESIESQGIDLQQVERRIGDALIDAAIRFHLGVVADSAQQTIGYAWRAAGSLGDSTCAARIDRGVENGGGAVDDPLEILDAVELQALDDPEAIAQG